MVCPKVLRNLFCLQWLHIPAPTLHCRLELANLPLVCSRYMVNHILNELQLSFNCQALIMIFKPRGGLPVIASCAPGYRCLSSFIVQIKFFRLREYCPAGTFTRTMKSRLKLRSRGFFKYQPNWQKL
jgi:hypothetical protein